MRTSTFRAAVVAVATGVVAVFGAVVTAPAASAAEESFGEITDSADRGNLPRIMAGSSAECGGTAPVTTACTTYGSFVVGPFRVGCQSTLAYSGYLNVTLHSYSGSMAFTCYFAGGAFVSNSTPTRSGHFVENEVYTLSATGLGSGGWKVYLQQ